MGGFLQPVKGGCFFIAAVGGTEEISCCSDGQQNCGGDAVPGATGDSSGRGQFSGGKGGIGVVGIRTVGIGMVGVGVFGLYFFDDLFEHGGVGLVFAFVLFPIFFQEFALV